MLIISQPRSASRSLVDTLKIITGLNCGQARPKYYREEKCDGFKEMQKGSGMSMIPWTKKELFDLIVDRKKIMKTHVLPEKMHLDYLYKNDLPVLIQLRTPEHAADSYCRIESGKKEININNVIKEHKLFFDLYKKLADEKKNYLIIYYEELVLDYQKTMRKILKHFKIKLKKGQKIISLKKRHYSKIGEMRLT